MVDPGQSPREPIRRAFTVGQTASFSLTVASELHRKVNDLELPTRPMPQTTMTLRSEVLRVHDDGSASVRFTITNASISEEQSAAVHDDLARTYRQDLNALQGTEITYTVSPQGQLNDPGVILKGNEPLTSTANQLLEQFKRALEQIVIPLPNEPVGPGARWRVSTPIDLAGIKAIRMIEYQLIERHEGDRLELGFIISVNADRQVMRDSNIPAGAELLLTNMAGTGDGVGLLELNAPVATRVSWRAAVDRSHLYTIPVTGKPPRQEKLDFLLISATTAEHLPTETPAPAPARETTRETTNDEAPQ